MQARRLNRRYGIYSIDRTQPPVAIQLLQKVFYCFWFDVQEALTESFYFDEKDYQLALRIQSDLTNQRDNDHVVKLYHLMGNSFIHSFT